MSNPSLGDYLSQLKTSAPDEILELNGPVPRDFVVMALATELDRRHRPPIILGHLEGYREALVANIFASRSRIAAILRCQEQEISQRWSVIEKNPIKPVIVKNAAVQSKVLRGDEIDVSRMPIMQHYATDGGRYITSGIVVAKDPDTGIRNLSFHRMQVKGPRRFGISLHSRQHLFGYFQRAESRGENLEAAVIVGAHPAFLLAASAKPAISVDEFDIAGSILGEPVDLVSGITANVKYPASAEIVLEGKILAGAREPEGPFGEFTGYSTPHSTENVFEVTAMCSRPDPYYLSIIPGSASDHLFLARVAREAAILLRLQEKIPAVKNICYPKSGVNFHCYLSLSRSVEGMAKQALMLLMGLDHYVKLAVVVDDDVDQENEEEVLWAVATRVQADKDIFIVPDVFTIPLDPSSKQGMSAKVGIDATIKERMRSEVLVCKPLPEHVEAAGKILSSIVKD